MQHFISTGGHGQYFSFQSSSGQKAGCNQEKRNATWTPNSRFQSSSGQKAGCNPYWLGMTCATFPFQSSSGQKAGCNRRTGCLASCFRRFQSSSGQKAGCNRPSQFSATSSLLFQSSSGQKAGCNFGRSGSYPCVSLGFNPHPARRPDATPPKPGTGLTTTSCFNPHPARRPDATLSRLTTDSVGSLRFNPHPARRPDATGLESGVKFDLQLFQSSSGQKAGCNHHRPTGLGGLLAGFNPHPARRPDATPIHKMMNRMIKVSILIRPEGRMQHRYGPRATPGHLRVSILIRPEGRMQRGVFHVGTLYHWFQSSSGQKAGCNPPQAQLAIWPGVVSILIRPEGRMQHA